MKKKNITISFMLIILIILLLLVLLLVFNKKDKKIEYDFTNKIYHYGDYLGSGSYQPTYIFMQNGNFYHFVNQYDESCLLRALRGTWKRNNDEMDINLEYAIFYDGGELIKTDDIAYFGVRRENYSLVKKVYEGITNLGFNIKRGVTGDKYMDYLKINSDTYYPIYEFDTEEDLYKKLEEMYGEVFTMLISDSIKVQKESNLEA